jgi:hypothetical protein
LFPSITVTSIDSVRRTFYTTWYRNIACSIFCRINAPLPAIFVVDRLTKLRDFNGVSGEEIPLPIPTDASLPITAKILPQPLHYVENADTKPFHATRIEFKRGFPTGT